MRIILLLLFIWIGRISADNPVMCMLHQIVGHWTFVLDSSDEGVFKKDLHSPKISCHKGQPGRVLKISAKDDLRFKQSTKLFVEFTQNSKFNLYDDEKVIAGNYTLLIHEGFMAFVNNTVFMNFWRYNYEGNDTFDSVCYKTMIGWYHTIAQKEGEEEKWGCFYGYKYHIFDADVDTKNHVKMNYDGPIRPKKINNMDIANKLVKMSKQRKLLFTLDDDIFHFKNKNNKSNSDSKLSKSEIEIKSTAYKDAVKNKETIIDQFYGRDTSSITEEQLPENLNWADVNGESFFPEIIHQKCGECYLDSFVQVYQSRVRIKTRNKLKPNISIQHIIDCNFYSEGCDGGFAISAAKFAWEFFLVDDECYSTNCQHDDINLNTTVSMQLNK